MKIHLQKAVDSVTAYLGSQATQIPSMREKFIMFAALGAAKANTGSLLNPYMATLKMLGVIDDSNMVCTDAIRAAMDSAFSNLPTFSALGFNFTQADADELLRIMEA